jgi:hypothetical protein
MGQPPGWQQCTQGAGGSCILLQKRCKFRLRVQIKKDHVDWNDEVMNRKGGIFAPM